jgi:hypothetical protein
VPTPFGIETLTELPPVVELESEKMGDPVVSWYIPADARPIPAPIAITIRTDTMILV